MRNDFDRRPVSDLGFMRRLRLLGLAAAAREALRQWRAESRVGSSIPAGKHQV